MKSVYKHMIALSLAATFLCSSAGAWNMGTTDPASQYGCIAGNDNCMAIVDENNWLFTMGTAYWTNLQNSAASSNPQLLMKNVQSVAMTDVDFLILTKGGELWGMGRQGSWVSQMTGSEGVVAQPTKLMNGVADMKISASDGENRTVGILTTDGTLQCWSTLGTSGSYEQRTLSGDVAAFSVCGNGAAYIKKDGTAWAWAQNPANIFGSAVDTSSYPYRIFADYTVKGISITDDGCLMVTGDGEVYATGTNTSGRFGIVNKGAVVDNNGQPKIYTTPTLAASAGTRDAILTDRASFILKDSGNVFAAGDNSNGGLGVSQSKTEIASYTYVAEKVTAITARDENIMLVKEDGTLQSSGLSIKNAGAKVYSLLAVDYPESTPDPITPLTDIDNHWAKTSMEFAYANGLMKGTGNNTFSPDQPASRATIVYALYVLSGKPGAPACTFTDVPAGAYYADAVAWAQENGIVSGMGDGLFLPDANVTREQLAVMMFNYVNWRKLGVTYANLDSFDDQSSISSWATNAVRWMVSTNLLHGITDTQLAPKGTSTRAQLATILNSFVQQYKLNIG